MLQYIFFIYNSTTKEFNEESNNENYCILYQNQGDYFLEEDSSKKNYNSEHSNQNGTTIKTRARISTRMSCHPYEKPKSMLNEFESPIPLGFSNEVIDLTQDSEENSQNDVLDNESEKSLSENNTSTLQNGSVITFKHFNAKNKKNSKKTCDFPRKKKSLDILADEMLEFQNEFLENNQNETWYNTDVMQNFQELQKSYQTQNLKMQISELNCFIEKEFVYDKQFIMNFLKIYNKPIQEKNYNSSRYALYRWKSDTRSILSSKVPSLIKLISESSLEKEKKDHLLGYIEFIKISLEHIIKLVPNYHLKSKNIIKLLYWYMRFINEKNILDNLFDLAGLQKKFFNKNIPILSINDNFIDLNNCLINCYNKERYAKICIGYILSQGQ